MRYSVFGAGFLGSNLCRALVRQGHYVRAFGRSMPFPDALIGCDWMPGDFANPASIVKAISGCDVVFHLITATTPISANIDKITDNNANVVNTLQLLNACRETGVRRIVFVSSGGTIYGIPNQLPTPESAATNPITAYGISKLSIEKYLGLYEYLHGLEFRVLRVANPFGPYQIALKSQGVIAAFLHGAIAGKTIEIWGDGRVIRDYVYIDDVVDALILAASHQGSGRVFNIGGGEGRSLNDVVVAIESLLSYKIPVEHRPGRSVDVPVSVLDTTLAESQLGWRAATKFEEGLGKTLDWMKVRSGDAVL